MPTKKRRVGFIPRSDVLDLLNNLSFENNLSISKIINILVEEALCKRGIFNKKNVKNLNDKGSYSFINKNIIKLNNNEKEISNEINDFRDTENVHIKEANDVFIDNEIYSKFLLFLQFQEKMKKNN